MHSWRAKGSRGAHLKACASGTLPRLWSLPLLVSLLLWRLLAELLRPVNMLAGRRSTADMCGSCWQ
jgi:hypothetical protein